MRCPLCKTVIPQDSKRCHVCDIVVAEPSNADPCLVVDTIDASHKRYSAPKIVLFFAILVLLAAPWLLMNDLFRVPQEVIDSRAEFQKLATRYHEGQPRWHAEKEQLLENMRLHPLEERMNSEGHSFDNVPLEVFMALLWEDLKFSKDKFRDVTVFPIVDAENPTFLITKYEHGMWPLRILLSLEVQLNNHGNRLTVEFRRLRRGNRDISQDFAWVYFGPELKLLRQLEVLAGGVSHLRIYPTPAPTADCSLERLAWRFDSSPPL